VESMRSDPATSPEKIVREFIATVNSHDVEAVGAMVAEDASVAFAGFTPFEGRDRIGDYFAFFAGFHARWDYTSTESRDNVVSGTMAAHDEWSEAAGISPLVYAKFELTVRDGLIARIDTEFTKESNQALSELLERFTPWAAAKHPELYDEEGDYIYDESTGSGMVAAIRDWVASDSMEDADG